MRTPISGAAFISTLRDRLAEALTDLVQAASLVAFLAMSVLPQQALAFAQGAADAQAPLQFIRDATLPDTTAVGIEVFPSRSPFEALLMSVPAPTPATPIALTAGTTLQVVATAYSSTADQTDGNPFVTASGTRVRQGTVAANFLPFGSQIRVNGQVYTVEDRLHARYNGAHVIDIWHPTREEALTFGIRVLPIEIVSISGQ